MALEKKMRNPRIDTLRFIGLSLIILAHTNPPAWLFQLRNFGAPLMVLVSGASFGMFGKPERYASYIWKRIKRLLFPAWIFITCYFIFIYLTKIPLERFSWTLIVQSYALTGGVGFLWIIRVLLVVGLLAPLITRISLRIPGNAAFIGCILSAYIAYELALYLVRPYLHHTAIDVAVLYVFYGVAFGLIFALGVRVPALGAKWVAGIALLFFMIFAAMAVALAIANGNFVSTQEYKYPPSAYYLSYGLSMSLFSWALVQSIPSALRPPAWVTRLVMYIARNSMWIYLWHIPLVKLVNNHPGPSFFLRYGFVYGAAVAAVFLQVSLVQSLILPQLRDDGVRRNVKILLTG
jgi:fucose 4-O-acetylase-like acetyltransferase